MGNGNVNMEIKPNRVTLSIKIKEYLNSSSKKVGDLDIENSFLEKCTQLNILAKRH